MKEYFNLTGLDGDYEQLVILIYENVMPSKIQNSLQDCLSTDAVWKRLAFQFPTKVIPQAILNEFKCVKPMNSTSAFEMSCLLEHIKEYTHNAKEVGCDADLSCYATILTWFSKN